jgi:hypothetical protein
LVQGLGIAIVEHVTLQLSQASDLALDQRFGKASTG